jgi:SET domain-containing protein
LFTAIDFYKGEVVSIFRGETIDELEADRRIRLLEDQYFIVLLDGRILDSKYTDCFAKYANDAEGLENNAFKNNAYITLDDDNEVCIVATRNIKLGEEIFCAYGKSYWEKHGR